MTNNNFRARSSSGNGTSGNHEEGAAPNPEERRQNLKYVVFYLVVAIVLFLNNRVSKHPTDNGNLSQSASNLGIDLSEDRKFEGNGSGSNGTLFVFGSRTRGTNRFSILYPWTRIAPSARSSTELLPNLTGNRFRA